MSIHDDMAFLGRALKHEDFEGRIGVCPAVPGTFGIAEILDALGDGEAHTIGTLDRYLQAAGIELSGCQIAACLVRLHLDGHRIQLLPPYDGFGCPERFKLTGSGMPREAS